MNTVRLILSMPTMLNIYIYTYNHNKIIITDEYIKNKRGIIVPSKIRKAANYTKFFFFLVITFSSCACRIA